MAASLIRVLLAFGVVSSGALGAPADWKSTIDVFLAADAVHPPQPNGIVFVGSSSIVRWESLATDFAELPVINRGFGGSELADSVAYLDQIVLPYQPRAVLLYAGDNDIAAGKSAEGVLADFQAFRAKIQHALPAARIYYLSIKFSPLRAEFQPTMQRANQLIAADCAGSPHCTFVDVNSTMLDAEGKVRPELFEPDLLHMKLSSYQLWVKKLRPLLQP